jgi:glutamate-ammonia-ligase adenylyltransferase
MTPFKLSPFIDKQFKQRPELHNLISGELDLTQDWQKFIENQSFLDTFSLLRQYRQSRLALIAAKDLSNAQQKDPIYTLKQTSLLAKVCITHAYNIALQELINKWGLVVNDKNQTQSFIIFALGKLGGHELNFSSDVDLVFCFSGHGYSNGEKSIDASSYFQKLGRRIIQILDSTTKDGIVYRVDMRLRPFGSAAPLVCTVSNLVDYLESEGRDWERYAWLRASFIAGNKANAKQILESIQPFIYRKYIDYNVFESLRQIKEQITRNQANDKENLKLGEGGIREIEFIVQTLQLTFAGRNKQLRGNDLWQQMHNLMAFKHLSVKELQQLTDAWLFLRKLENLCQIINDKDTHHLPENCENIAYYMGSINEKELFNQLTIHRENVHHIFQQLFLSNQNKQLKPIKNNVIQLLKDEVSQKNYPKANKHKIYAALDAIIPIIEKHDNSDVIIHRYKKIIDAISKRSSYLSMLIESPLTLEKLIQQISYSGYFSQMIVKTPSLLEILFDGIELSDFDIKKQWHYFSKRHKLDDEELYLEILCQFKQTIQFKAIMAYIENINNALVTSKILSNLAEHILKLVITQAWKHIQKSYPSDIKIDDLIIIAYGSLATRSMHLNSDFDIVFVLNLDINSENHKFIMRWIKRIIHLLSINSYSGSLYQLDTQLRPNGNSGAAIVSKTSFQSYLINEAWIWEHAALIKSRTAYATQDQKKWFTELRREVLCQKRDSNIVVNELKDMAQKLKLLSHKDHQKEFDLLGDILNKAHKNPDSINHLPSNSKVVQSKLDDSILNT